MQKIRLAIILVNYKSIVETINYCLHELSKIPEEYILVIVNNSSEDESDYKLANALNSQVLKYDSLKKYPPNHIHGKKFIISATENLGYAKGNNVGVNFIINNFEDISYFLITNNDLKICSENTVDILVKQMDSNENIGMIGPKIIGLDGKNQSPHRKLSFWELMIFPKLLYPLWALLCKAKIAKTEIVENAQKGFYHRIMGSFMILKKESFIAANGFDENTFLYAEELILSERMRRQGYGSYFLPSVKVIHNHGNVTKKAFEKKKIIDIYNTSILYYFKTYRNTSKLETIIFQFSNFLYNNLFLKCCKISNRK